MWVLQNKQHHSTSVLKTLPMYLTGIYIFPHARSSQLYPRVLPNFPLMKTKDIKKEI